MGVVSTDKCLKMNSVDDGTTNLGVSKCPWLDSVDTCTGMVFQFSRIDTVPVPINAIEEGHKTRGDTHRGPGGGAGKLEGVGGPEEGTGDQKEAERVDQGRKVDH